MGLKPRSNERRSLLWCLPASTTEIVITPMWWPKDRLGDPAWIALDPTDGFSWTTVPLPIERWSASERDIRMLQRVARAEFRESHDLIITFKITPATTDAIAQVQQ